MVAMGRGMGDLGTRDKSMKGFMKFGVGSTRGAHGKGDEGFGYEGSH